MGRGRAKRNATTIQLVDYTGTSNNTQSTGTQSANIVDAEETSMKQWPPLSATKKGMKIPHSTIPLLTIDSAKIATGNQLKDVNPSSRQTDAFEQFSSNC